MKLAVIPARGGSKRIPGKNIRDFCGRPIIAYSITAALNSGCFDEVVVSTDDKSIAGVAREYGASVPFLRPLELSDDHVGVLPVVRHAVEWFRDQGRLPELACCIYATAPFVTAHDLYEGARALAASGADYAISVTTFEFPIQRALRINDDGRLEMLQPRYVVSRSQDLEEAYHDAGQFCWGRAQAFLDGRPLLSEAAAPVILPRHRVQDIDTEEDWRRAELLYEISTRQQCTDVG